MKHLILTFILITINSLYCAEPLKIDLWPEGPPSSNEITKAETGKGFYKNVTQPRIMLYLPEKSTEKTPCVLVIPGGGYGTVCATSEGTPLAHHLNNRGIAAAVLIYRLPNGHSEVPGDDARRALRIIRHHAEEWNIDREKCGVWGFSAGGHLASTVSTINEAGKLKDDPIETISAKVNFTILFYAVISMKNGITHKGSRKNLTGKEEFNQKFSNELNVSKSTPPAFLLASSADSVVSYYNSMQYYENLIKHKVPSHMLLVHTKSHGPKIYRNNPSWEVALDEWLASINCLPGTK
ncbi:MAG: alpha/beta hydrolase [Planctomycetes bacterium]|nr:alpha/beta hydrolase [Planctomycetota bacterium]